MTLNLTMPSHDELKPRITVFGVGGAGGNAVNNMIEKQLDGCEFVVANTDAQALAQSAAQNRVQMGVKVTEGLGAGARAAIGAAAAEESIEEIVDHLAGAHMCFITAGMGGGTGTGATPIIAQAARELGVLTVGVVTKPFQFEGTRRMRQAEEGIETLQKMVDTLIIIPNQNLFRLANEKTTCTDAFGMADDVLYQGVKGVTDLMVRPGLINLDFADVRAVMDEMGKAMMGTGEAEGEDRAMQAAEKAIANPLLDEISLHGAKGVLINVTGGSDLTLYELDEAANVIREKVDPDANIIVGSTLDESMAGRMRVSVVATGIDTTEVREAPVAHRRLAEPKAETAAAEADELPAPAYEAAARTEAEVAETPDDDFFGGWDKRRSGGAAAEMPAAARKPGQPSSEVASRLEAAVRKQPGEGGRAAPRPVAGSRPQPVPQPDRPRFGIGTLINRVSGEGRAQAQAERPQATPEPRPQPEVEPVAEAEPAQAAPQPRAERPAPIAAAPARRAPAPARMEDEDETGNDQDKIEIPAFLRRQAN